MMRRASGFARVAATVLLILAATMVRCDMTGYTSNSGCRDSYEGDGIHAQQITGFWTAKGEALHYIHRNGVEMLQFGRDMTYYWKRKNEHGPNRFYESWGTYSIGGKWHEKITCWEMGRCIVVEYPDDDMDTNCIFGPEADGEGIGSMSKRMLFHDDGLIQYEIQQQSYDCGGYTTLRIAEFSRADSVDFVDGMWEMIPQPDEWR